MGILAFGRAGPSIDIMPKKPTQTRNPENEPTVRAAHITAAGAEESARIGASAGKRNAIIAATGVVLVALISAVANWILKMPPSVDKNKFVGRVTEKATGKNIRGAKVSLEGSDVPPVTFTDSEGVFSFPLNDPSKEVRIRVEVVGYEGYDRRVIPAENPGIHEIRLEPLKTTSASSSPSVSRQPPDVGLRFVYPKSPALVLKNLSGSVARDIKWTVALWNIDIPGRINPLPIPVSTFDWIKPYDEGGPQNLFDGSLVAPLLKPGNRLIGSASVSCPECTRGRTYFIYIIWGSGGWVSEVKGEKSGRVIVPHKILKGTLLEYLEHIETQTPAKSKISIGER